MESLIRILTPDPGLEVRQRLFQMMCLISAFFSLVLIVSNFLERLPLALNAGLAFGGLVYVLLFLLARMRGAYCYKSFCLPTVFVLDWSWFFNGGSAGPVPMFFFGAALLFTVLLRGRVRWFFLVGFVLNILALYFVEFSRPGLIVPYASPVTRLQDITISFPLSVFICIFMMMAAMRAYDSERRELAASNIKLEETLSEIRVLRGLLPICSGCKKIRSDDGRWANLEMYIEQHSHASFTHGMCPECTIRYYGVEVAMSQD